MISHYPETIERVIKWFSLLPGVGYKSAERMVMKLLEMSLEDIQEFSTSMVDMKKLICHCRECNSITDKDVCNICSAPNRDTSLLCVVETSKDMFAIERGNAFRGLYCVLGGKLSPLNGIGPERLAFDTLEKIIKNRAVSEVVLATGSDVEGDATAVYTNQLLKATGIKVTRIAYGVPVGGSLDFADELTLMRAIEGRNEY